LLNACATNLAALQRLSEEQTDVLKGLTTTLRITHSLKLGSNLNSLTESLTAALEPMKGQLANWFRHGSTYHVGLKVAEPHANERQSPDQTYHQSCRSLSAGLD